MMYEQGNDVGDPKAKVERAGGVGFIRRRSVGGLAGLQRRSGGGVDQRNEGPGWRLKSFNGEGAGAQGRPPTLICPPQHGARK